MNRREKIRLTLERIKVTKSLTEKLAEFIELARGSGYEPVHSIRTLERFEAELRELRLAHVRTGRVGGLRSSGRTRRAL